MAEFQLSISFRTPISKAHNFISQLNSVKQPNDDRRYDIIQDGYPIISGKKKADMFTNIYKNDCSDFHSYPTSFLDSAFYLFI